MKPGSDAAETWERDREAFATEVHPAPPHARPPLPPGPYLVAGLGRAGETAIGALLPLVGADRVAVWDEHEARHSRDARRRLRAAGVRVWIADHTGPFQVRPSPACVVKSPGFLLDHRLIAAARERGIPVLDEMEVGWRLGTAPVIGVTGTNGKSTVTHLAARCLEDAGRPAAIAGNIEIGPPYSGVQEPSGGWTVCEASSAALESSPAFLPEVAVFTNLTHDHLNRHGDMRAYGDCKRQMFVRGEDCARLAIVNVDDDLGRRLAAEVAARGGSVVGYGTSRGADYRIRRQSWDVRSGRTEIDARQGALVVHSRLPGPHNALNVTAALALARALGLERGRVLETLATAAGVPGRFELIEEGQPFDAIVDHAHSPDALRKVMRTAREILHDRPGGRLLAVASSPAGADPTKRLPMGEAVGELADVVILTTAHRRGEPAESLIAELLRGARGAARARIETEPERRAAIHRAVELARPDDVLLVLGRGLIRRLEVTPARDGPVLDDREVLREALRGL